MKQPPGKEKYIVSYLCNNFPKYICSLFSEIYLQYSKIVGFLKIKIQNLS